MLFDNLKAWLDSSRPVNSSVMPLNYLWSEVKFGCKLYVRALTSFLEVAVKKDSSSFRVVISALLLISSALLATAQQMQNSSPSSNKSRPSVSVKGAVRTPMRLELRRRVRLLEVLAMAGGTTEYAKGKIQIERVSSIPANKTSKKPSISIISVRISDVLRGETKANPYLLPGDVVTVFEWDKSQR
jgi:SLBB domain